MQFAIAAAFPPAVDIAHFGWDNAVIQTGLAAPSMETRLTIKLPEELRRRAQERAALEGTTLSQVLRERLEEFAAGWDAIEDAADARAVEEIEARIARGEERVRDWAEVDAELNGLSDQDH